MKRLYKSRENKIITGILGGLGEYTTIDPVIVRLIFILVTLVTGFFPFALMYLLAIFIIPDPPVSQSGQKIYEHE